MNQTILQNVRGQLSNSRRALVAVSAAAAISISLGAAPAAHAIAYFGASIYNMGGTAIGVVTTWTTPNSWQYLLYPGQTSGSARGIYTGATWCTDVYYSRLGGGYGYVWTNVGGLHGRFASFAIQTVDNVAVKSYQCNRL